MAGNAKLTEIKIRTAKAREKSYKLADGGGLYLLVATDGTRYWRYTYRFHGAYRTMSFGIYPEVSAKAAREQHQEARPKLAAGVDPMAERKLQKLAAREEAEWACPAPPDRLVNLTSRRLELHWADVSQR